MGLMSTIYNGYYSLYIVYVIVAFCFQIQVSAILSVLMIKAEYTGHIVSVNDKS